MYILISLALIAISLFLINFSKIERFRTENKRSFDFCLSLISTFTGLFIALSVNTILGQIQQKNNLVKLLNTTNLAIENAAMRTQGMYINTAKSGISVTSTVQNTPLELPKLYPTLETNSLINDYFSPNGFQAYIACMDNLQFYQRNVNAANTTDQKKLEALNYYVKYLNLAKKVNEVEIDKLNKKISTKEENEALNQLNNQLK